MKWIGRIVLAGVVLCVVAIAAFFAASEWVIRRPHAVAEESIVADRSDAGVREGERLAHVLSCLDCHGPQAQGRVLVNKPMLGILSAPGLAPLVRQASDADLARTIRHGVRRNGATLWAMPARIRLADDDTARLIGYLRSLQPTPEDLQERADFGPVGRLQILRGQLEPSVRNKIVAPAHRPSDEGPYLVNLICLSCHDLYRSRPVGPVSVAPPLAAMASAYDDKAFTRLMRTGVGLSPHDLGEMRVAAQTGFTHFTDPEIAAIKRYLTQAAAAAPN